MYQIAVTGIPRRYDQKKQNNLLKAIQGLSGTYQDVIPPQDMPVICGEYTFNRDQRQEMIVSFTAPELNALSTEASNELCIKCGEIVRQTFRACPITIYLNGQQKRIAAVEIISDRMKKNPCPLCAHTTEDGDGKENVCCNCQYYFPNTECRENYG